MIACLKLIFSFLTYFLLFFILVAFVPGLPPHEEFPLESLTPSSPREGPYAPNNVLDKAQRIFEDEIVGPESVAHRGRPNEIFASLYGGSIVKMFGPSFKNMKEVTKIGPGCKGPWEEKICGRPLGLRFSQDGKLIVIDAYFGIFEVDVDSGKKELLYDAQNPINGKKPLLLNDLDIDREGNIYWSDSSTVGNLAQGVLEVLAGPTGRLMKRDAKTGHTLVLVDELLFANGVQLSPDQDFVLVADTFRSRVVRYWLKGNKAGTQDVFVDGLPGFPDNIRAIPGGGYYVPLVGMKDPDAVDMLATVLRLPWLRRLLARVGYGTAQVLTAAADLFQSEAFAKASYMTLNLVTFTVKLGSDEGSMIVAVDPEGHIQYTLQSSSGVVGHVSEVTQTNDELIFGSPFNKFLAIISLDQVKAGPAVGSRSPQADVNKRGPATKQEL
ncbi:Strictosidine synthase conserved region [Trinorchestia longiramus]|nr:Strictosidine synthase conserved region [Trinorchestia longiramus]